MGGGYSAICTNKPVTFVAKRRFPPADLTVYFLQREHFVQYAQCRCGASRLKLHRSRADTQEHAEKQMTRTPEEALRMAREHGARMIDFKFTDVPGTWQHFSVPTRALDESSFAEGIGF